MNKIHFSSQKHDWETPIDFFNQLNTEFDFTCDVCATKENAKVKNFFSIVDDGLIREWQGRCWMNPPYGREIGKWLKKAYKESLNGILTVCLVPSRTDTKWWHDYAMRGTIRFIKGRLQFKGALHKAPFPSAIVIFSPWHNKEKSVDK